MTYGVKSAKYSDTAVVPVSSKQQVLPCPCAGNVEQAPLGLASVIEYCRANAMMSAVGATSSSPVWGSLRCVAHGWPSTRQANRSDTLSWPIACLTQSRRRAGLRSFPKQLPSKSVSPVSGQRPPAAAAYSPPPTPSAASVG